MTTGDRTDKGDDDPISAEHEEDLDRPLNEVLGIEVHFAPDDLAPPVDEGRLLAFCRDELPPQEREEVLNLISSFRSWLEAWGKVLRRKAR
jgi:hypothetical protein